MESKPTNPKDRIGVAKLPLDLVPDSAIAFGALGFTEGDCKYGGFNWALAGVRWSIYDAALERHRMKFKAGEWADPKTKVPHLASMFACISIIIDAHVRGMLIDDRPPANPELVALIDKMSENVQHLQELFKELSPHRCTIADTLADEPSPMGADLAFDGEHFPR